MLQDKNIARALIFIPAGLFLGFALFANVPALHQGFLFADQAVYYSMAQSLAFDGDLEYTQHDLIRYNEDFWAGPNGIFLKKIIRDGRERYYYAKSFVYALFAAPFVWVFGPNGPLVGNAVLLFLLLLMGWSYFSLANSPGLSAFKILTFLGASVAGIYAFWITPDFFNLFLVFTVLFLWRYKRYESKDESASGPGTAGGNPGRPGWLRRFLLSPGSDYLAAAVAGIVVFSKPTNIVLTAPLVLSAWLVDRKFWRALLMGLILVAVAASFFGANGLWTGDWNYQGGERRSFYKQFPLEKKGVTFDSIAGSQRMTTDGYLTRSVLPVKFIPANLFWYFFGRFTGIAWYFFPALLFLILFFMGKKSLDRGFILGAALLQILVYVFLMPDNYGGGGGSLANRYFMNIYPMFLFLPGAGIRRRELVLPWAVAAVFLAPILLSPLQTSASPSMHAKKFPFTLLPVEYTLVGNLPTNTTPSAHRQRWGMPYFEDRFLYFLNDNYNDKAREENGWWTYGDRTTDMILRTFFPVREVVVHLLNNPRMDNRISVTLDGRTQAVVLNSMEKADLRFPVGPGFVVRESHQYRLKIRAAKGSIPYYENRGSQEKRHLGAFFELELIPR